MLRPVRLAGRLGQVPEQPYADALKNATREVRHWDELLYRLAAIRDDAARKDILDWIGRADIPGSPAERYAAVRDTLVAGYTPDEIFAKRVDELDYMLATLQDKIVEAEASGTLPAPKKMGAGSTPEAGISESCVLGGVSLLGLIVIPLLLD